MDGTTKAFWKNRAICMSLLVIIGRGQPNDLNMSVETLDESQKANALEGVKSSSEPLKKSGQKQQAELEDTERQKCGRQPRIPKDGMAESGAEQPTSR
jgi:hypothetical protein